MRIQIHLSLYIKKKDKFIFCGLFTVYFYLIKHKLIKLLSSYSFYHKEIKKYISFLGFFDIRTGTANFFISTCQFLAK